MKKVLVTGVSSGLGEAIALECLERGWEVHAMGRTPNKRFENRPGYYFFQVDLGEVDLLRDAVIPFVRDHDFDLVILNAGVLGEIKPMPEISLEEIRHVMDVNVWANKQIVDALLTHAQCRQIVAVSSGAARNAHKGWGSYAISKAALNTMIKLYAHENPAIHFSAIAPGVIMTPMLQRLFKSADPSVYDSVQRIRDGLILSPEEGARRFLAGCEKALEHESGSFLDVRTMDLQS